MPRGHCLLAKCRRVSHRVCVVSGCGYGFQSLSGSCESLVSVVLCAHGCEGSVSGHAMVPGCSVAWCPGVAQGRCVYYTLQTAVCHKAHCVLVCVCLNPRGRTPLPCSALRHTPAPP